MTPSACGRVHDGTRDPDTACTAVQTILMACRDFVTAVAVEGERHADRYEDCALAAQACRRCEEACQRLLPRPF